MEKKNPQSNLGELPFRDANLPLEERVGDLLGRLTLEEKLDLCSGEANWYTKKIPRLSVPAFAMTDGPHGIGPHSSGNKECTYFPVGICRAATWNPDLSHQFGVALGQEVREIGYQMILGPGVNILRTPLCGRNFEYQTEDPCLNARLIVGAVKGIQSQRVAACVKHYACNNQEQWRLWVDAIVSERVLRELYLPAFEAAAREADAWSVMACYNRVNGLFGCEQYHLIRELLMEDWGFRGFVVSDWGAMNFVLDPEKAQTAGMSLEMPEANKYNLKILQPLFQAGRFTLEALNDNVRRLLRVMFLVGLFDDPALLPPGSRNTPAHQMIARKIAEEGIVLLKNAENLLPLNPATLKKLAVVGPNADREMGAAGGSSNVKPPYEITPLAGIKERCAAQVTMTDDPASADAAVVVVGLNHDGGLDSEGADRKNYDLPAAQVSLIQQTIQQNPKTVVVLVNGTPVGVEAWIDVAPAVVEMWYAGMEGGRALASILFGDVNPSGRLPVTFPKQLADCPAHASEETYPGVDTEDAGPVVRYDEGIFIGYRHYDSKKVEPRFPFGHGLSYTTFTYTNLQVTPSSAQGDTPVSVTCDIANTGPRAGAEVVQLYLRDDHAHVPRPFKELKGFQKVFLTPGRTQKVTFGVKKPDLSYFDERTSQWVVAPGTFEVLVGSSAQDIRLQGKFEYKK